MKNDIHRFRLALATVLAILLLGQLAQASSEIMSAAEGVVKIIEPSQSILIQVNKSQHIEISMANIKTLVILDSRNISDGVLRAIILGGGGGAMGGATGVVDPPNTLGKSNNKLRNSTVVGLITAGFSVAGTFCYNALVRKRPRLVYGSNSDSPGNLAIINNLTPGIKVRITYKNHVNGSSEPHN